MKPEFWHERWRASQIGFHQSAVDLHLREQWPNLALATGSRTFVPLCGKSLDLLWLREQGHWVTGVELSDVALESFCMEHGIPARRRIFDGFDLYESEKLQLFCGDFFSLTRELLGRVASVYDRAALISWAPELRETYVRQVAALTDTGTQTLLIALEYPPSEMHGPPFPVSADEVNRLYTHTHVVQRLSRRDILASEARLRSRGLTQLHEVCYRLIRL